MNVFRCIWDHPRVCGEKSTRHILMAHATGSPPRMRGKAEPEAAPRPALRITPAYAGKRVRVKSRGIMTRDHPRVCGEKAASAELYAMLAGSPPRMRGKVDQCNNAATVGGITPAYAGKRGGCHETDDCHGDHPRVCGEKAFPADFQRTGEGITPAYAGKRIADISTAPVGGDHPRVCGEKTVK